MPDILSQLFSSDALIKIMRLFLLNPEEIFDLRDVCRRTKISLKNVRRELKLLSNIEFIRSSVREEEIQLRGKHKTRKKKIEGWRLNSQFSLLPHLKVLILDTTPIDRDKLLYRFNDLGSRLKLVMISGIFLDDENSRVDMLIVGDSISRSRLERILSSIEAELGKEIKYAVFSTDEFLYRVNMYDHFIRDILNAPHEKLLNKFDA
ncbi:hypothetical protein IIA95_03155 [Patescibacteria group bacterium]|nr:hypothetical protein [Patescibacteria group bacterium]